MIWNDSLVGEALALIAFKKNLFTLRSASAGTVTLFNEPELLLNCFHDVLRPLTYEQRRANHQLPDYAANAPYIDFLRIFMIPQQELHSSVPISAHVC